MKTLILAAFAALLACAPALAAEHEVLMLDRGSDGREMVFEPAFLQIEPGDTVHFRATNLNHNAETIPGMIPEGAEPFQGALNEDISVTFTTAGAYGIKCAPHLGMGMVILILVGDDPHNLADMQEVLLPRGARAAFDTLYGEMDLVLGAAQ